jgi:hypothetical protein
LQLTDQVEAQAMERRAALLEHGSPGRAHRARCGFCAGTGILRCLRPLGHEGFDEGGGYLLGIILSVRIARALITSPGPSKGWTCNLPRRDHLRTTRQQN